MNTSHYPNVKSLLYGVLENATFDNLKNCRKNFIVNVLILFAGIKGRINFLQMSRFSGQCEQHFRSNFENKCNLQHANWAMIKDKITECVVAFAPCFINKSGAKTYGLGSYWSGCAKQAKRGLEICGFAAVDIPLNTAFHLNAIQTTKVENQRILIRQFVYFQRILIRQFVYFQMIKLYFFEN
ncbi:MAG: hypothetical protein LBG47_01305 [Prevotellaceae bacterium]|jgi:hypothetical protein|nr:hypothetical protein [Prevotellaceae bacterium]